MHSIGKERRTITRIFLASSSCMDLSSVCPCPEPGPKVSLSLLDLIQRSPVPACSLSTINKVYVVRRTYGVPSRPQLHACLTLIKLLYTGEPVALSLIPFHFLQQIAKHKVISATHSLKPKKTLMGVYVKGSRTTAQQKNPSALFRVALIFLYRNPVEKN